jgi:hypothetical protein
VKKVGEDITDRWDERSITKEGIEHLTTYNKHDLGEVRGKYRDMIACKGHNCGCLPLDDSTTSAPLPLAQNR